MSSKKFKLDWREVRENLNLFFFFMGVGLLLVLLAICIAAFVTAVVAVIFKACWNVAFTSMFGFKEITIFGAFVLFWAINGLRTNYFGDLKSSYNEIKKMFLDWFEKERWAKVLSILLIAVIITISMLITVYCVMYSWNTIMPQLIGVDLVHIDFIQALGFSFIVNRIFRVSSSNNYKKTKKNESKNSNKKGYSDESRVKTEGIWKNEEDDEVEEHDD